MDRSRSAKVRPARRWASLVALAAALTLTGAPPLFEVAFAHEGHATGEIGGYDLDAPRTVSPETAEHIGLKMAEVGFQPIEEVIEISGIVKPLPDHHRLVVSRVSGKVVLVTKVVGGSVEKGELIAQIDSPEFARNLYEVRKLDIEYQRLLLDIERSKAASDRLTAELEVAQAQWTYAKNETSRAESLVGEGLSAKDLAERKAAQAAAKGELRLKEIELDLTGKETANLVEQAKALRLGRDALLILNNIEPGTNLDRQLTDKLDINAEADGVVIELFVVPGEWIEAGQKILEEADYGTVQVEGELPESLIARIRARTTNKVRVRIPSNPSYLGEGTLRYMAPNLDPVKRTAHLIVDVQNHDGALLGEMWVNLSVALREVKSALVVPRAAVVVLGPMHFVFIQDEDQYRKQDIVPGYTDDQFIEVKAGVAPGDIVVVQGAYSLTQLPPKGSPKKASSETPPKAAY